MTYTNTQLFLFYASVLGTLPYNCTKLKPTFCDQFMTIQTY